MADFSQKFTYSGDGVTFTTQTFTAPADGLYKLEVYGASGGDGRLIEDISTAGTGGNGGYAYGYKILKKGDALYVGVGACNKSRTRSANGGGASSPIADGSGGGATHIALTNRGELKNYMNYQSEVLLVGGGGGAAGGTDYKNAGIGNGGNGGGLNGENGQPGYVHYNYGTGGTQNSAGASYIMNSYLESTGAGFGIGGYFAGGRYELEAGSGGGAGWYGGGGGVVKKDEDDIWLRCGGGGGGSSYIGGVPAITYQGLTYTPSTIAGGNPNRGHGWAEISLIQKDTPPIYLGDISISKIMYGDYEIKVEVPKLAL